MNTENRPYLALVAIFVVGVIAGFLVKSALKSKVTSSPDDRKITAVHQSFDFKGAQDRIEQQQNQELQNQQEGQGVPAVPGQ